MVRPGLKIIFSLVLMAGILFGLVQPILAQEAETITTGTQFPVLRAKSGESYEFEVTLTYTGGAKPREFQVALTPPEPPNQWFVAALQQFGGKEIAAIVLEPNKSFPDTIKVSLFPKPGYLPPPGEYTVVLKVGSGNLQTTRELKAVVTARYEMEMLSTTGRLNTEANAGEKNTFTVRLVNTGSAAVDSLTFAANKPEGWTITFEPEEVKGLEPRAIKDVNVIIQPADKTIAGDYVVTVRATGREVFKTMDIRVTVLTPSIWGWVGILIVVVVIAGLGVVFWKLGRR